MLRQKTMQKAPLGIDDLPSQSEEAEAAAIELRELRLIAARAEAKIACLHLHRMDRVLHALTTSITDCAQRALAASDEDAVTHRFLLSQLVADYLAVVRPATG